MVWLGVIRILKFQHILYVGLATAFLSGCNSTPQPNYQQAIDSNLVETDAFIKTLGALDSGDVAKARKIAIIPVFLNLDSVRYYSIKGLASPTAEQKEEWKKVARETLDYMLKHRDDWDSRSLDLQGGFRGLRYLLTDPEDVRRIDELSEYLKQNRQKRSEAPNNVLSDYRIAPGSTYDDIGTRGDVPPLVGYSFARLSDVALSLQWHGATRIVLAPFYPADVPSGFSIRPLDEKEQADLSKMILVERFIER